jgi:hypothetical protein
MAVQNVQVACIQFTCEVCGRTWLNIQCAVANPTRCPTCGSREWNGKKHPSRVHEIALPAPRKRGRPRSTPPSDDVAGDWD